MNRDILDQVAAMDKAESGFAPEQMPTQSKDAQYFLDASAHLLDEAVEKEKAYSRVPVTSALKITIYISAIREAQVELLEEALQDTTTEALKCDKWRRAKVLKLLGDALQSYPGISTPTDT
ncbi:hypothetical protein KC354_g16337 [Hortaea werneckii]|nr:hypothetical protein KC354_g16337 [Hortaea werneckii]